ncbi:MAG: PilT protein domain protein [Mucilaginibacter sp.]|nr:PilT protein domain protein [Mucilaginibacter sp.]
MDIVLVDTSVWINFFKAKETDASLFLKNNLSNIIIATCPVIIQEVLQGIVSDKEFKVIHSYFNNLIRFTDNPYLLAHDAAMLYRNLRKNGITIRKPNDCLIAMYAIKNGVALLNNDRDFQMIAKYASLKIMDFS